MILVPRVYWWCLFLIICLQDLVECLECWKCIDNDCEGNPENNYKATKMACPDQEACMKVRYTMNDNFTTYDSVIRTCSSGGCLPTTDTEFQKCKTKVRSFKISGCVLRSCCSDKDLCNVASSLSYSKLSLVILLIFALQSLS